ncbi:MAG: hypothetical protein A4E64_02891 [Syntrophorhabdus sp. PtaU1.Bin058]|nr:MAG: hypothetical protein A4E64_02891 [Syntrophorhabdus sp. PtaU1.Bin058]
MNTEKRSKNQVLFIARETVPSVGNVELHRFKENGLTRTLKEVKDDWRVVSKQVIELVEETEREASGKKYRLDQVTVGLGFNAKGKLAFLAEAGVEASVTVTFKRYESP